MKSSHKILIGSAIITLILVGEEIPSGITAVTAGTEVIRDHPQETRSEEIPRDFNGLPTDPGFAMNSNRITECQRRDLKSAPPDGYRIISMKSPRFAVGRDQEIGWRKVEDYGSLGRFLSEIGMPESAPDGMFADDRIIISPSGRRMLVVTDTSDRGKLFERKSSGWDLDHGKRIRSVTFDEAQRWFISWHAFLSESLIVGLSYADEELERYPELRLYTFDLDESILTRIRLSAAIQPPGVFEFYRIEAVASGALLLRLGYKEGRTEELFTIFLDGSEQNE